MKREYEEHSSESVYRKLSFLRSTNTSSETSTASYINTSLKLVENYIKVKTKIRFVGGIYGSLLSGRDSTGGLQVQGYNGSSKLRFWNGVGASVDIGSTLQKNTDYEIEFICNGKNISLTINNSSYTSSNGKTPLTCSQNIGMFASIRNTGLDSATNMRIYYCKIYNSSGIILRDFQPMLRIADQKPGMFDYITNSFYTQANPSAPEFEYE